MEERNKIIITISIFLIIISATIYSSVLEKKEDEDIVADNKLYKGPKILVEEQTCRNIFNNYLSEYKNFNRPEIERLSEYEINKIEVKKEKSDGSEFVCMVKYDVRPFTNLEANNWSKENGKYQDDWIKDKTCFLIVNKINGEYKITKNVANLDLSSVNLPDKIKYKVLRLT